MSDVLVVTLLANLQRKLRAMKELMFPTQQSSQLGIHGFEEAQYRSLRRLRKQLKQASQRHISDTMRIKQQMAKTGTDQLSWQMTHVVCLALATVCACFCMSAHRLLVLRACVVLCGFLAKAYGCSLCVSKRASACCVISSCCYGHDVHTSCHSLKSCMAVKCAVQQPCQCAAGKLIVRHALQATAGSPALQCGQTNSSPAPTTSLNKALFPPSIATQPSAKAVPVASGDVVVLASQHPLLLTDALATRQIPGGSSGVHHSQELDTRAVALGATTSALKSHHHKVSANAATLSAVSHGDMWSSKAVASPSNGDGCRAGSHLHTTPAATCLPPCFASASCAPAAELYPPASWDPLVSLHIWLHSRLHIWMRRLLTPQR